MPPKQSHDAIERDDDGRIVHHFRQSTIGSFDNCAEQGRNAHFRLTDRGHSDATAAGESMHAGIELVLNSALAENSAGVSADEAVEHAIGHWRELDAEGLKWSSWRDDANGRRTAERFIEGAVRLWHAEVYPTLRPQATEQGFNVHLYEDEQRVIRVSGTIDYIDSADGLVDWKTAGREWKAWEKQRWEHQPTVYSLAAWSEGWIDGAAPWPFTFYVFLKKDPVELQKVTVWRGPSDWSWLRSKCLAMAKLVEAELDEWPRNDNHVLCSAKWCDLWESCKGAHYPQDWPHHWKRSVPVSMGGTKR